MWLSKKIEKDPEAKEALGSISSLIKKYADPTDIHTNKFLCADIGKLFKPKVKTYIIAYFLILLLEITLIRLSIWQFSTLQDFVRINLSISVSILVFGISFSQIARGLSESSRLASDYLTATCEITKFASLTFLTVFFGILCTILFSVVEYSRASRIIYFFMSSFIIGGGIWCVMSLVYIILEIIKCMDPKTSVEYASKFAIRRLSYAFLKHIYISSWMSKYNELLEHARKNLKAFGDPNSLYFYEKQSAYKYVFKLKKEIDFHFGYRDYNLNKLKTISRILDGTEAELRMAPHGFYSNEFATLHTKNPTPELYEKINKKVPSTCKFKKDKYIEEDQEFWQDIYLELYKAFSKAVDSLDIMQFNRYIKSIQEPYTVLRKARKHPIAQKSFRLDYDKNRYLFLYTRSLERLLKKKDEINVGILEDFIHALEHSIWEQIKEDIEEGDTCTINTFRWLLPSAYQLFLKNIDDKNSRLWELRAFSGSSYDYMHYLFNESKSISKANRIEIKLVLHRGIIRWLLIALENEDQELAEALCGATKKLVFGDKGIALIPEELVTQHFILCGKILNDIVEKQPMGSGQLFRFLLHDRYSMRDIELPDFEELVEYYLENRKSRDLRHYLREFEKTRWQRNPLNRGGHGAPSYTFSGVLEFDYMFLYLAFLTMPYDSEEMKPVPADFSFYRLEEKIEKLKDVARDIKLYRYGEDSKGQFIEWLNNSKQLYKQQEQQKIISALLKDKIISEFESAFWEGYKNTKSFLDMCLRLECFKIDESVSVRGSFNHHKDIFIDKLNRIGAIGNSDGSNVSRAYSEGLLEDIIDKKSPDDFMEDYISQLDRACSWLIKHGLSEEKSLLLYYGNIHLEGELYKNDDYVPHWKVSEDDLYHGYYKAYPLMTVYKKEVEPICVAVKLEGWKGVKIRPEILEERFGRVTVREWTDTELDEFIRNGEIKEHERDEVRTRCPVEFELYWDLDKEDLPVQYSVGLKIYNPADVATDSEG